MGGEGIWVEAGCGEEIRVESGCGEEVRVEAGCGEGIQGKAGREGDEGRGRVRGGAKGKAGYGEVVRESWCC